MKVFESKCIQKYKCLIDKCELSCCKGWDISVSKEDVEKWKEKAPQLMRFLKQKDNTNDDYQMVRDENKNCCALTKEGKCSIQVENGENFIPNLCSYFPHIYKKVGDKIFSSATIACPAVVLCILNAKNNDWKFSNYERKYTKSDITDFSYRQENTDLSKIEKLHLKYLSILDLKNYDIDKRMAILVNMCYSNKGMNFNNLYDNFDKNLKQAKKNIEKLSNIGSFNSQYKILDTIDFIYQTRSISNELQSYITSIKKILGINENKKITSENIIKIVENYNTVRCKWENEIKPVCEKYLKNVIKAELNRQLFPFGCYFTDHYEMIVVLGFYYLFLRLIFMSEFLNKSQALDKRKVVQIISVIARNFYQYSTERTFDKICEKNWHLFGNLENAILFY